jgi:hypothetical protein
VGSPQLLYVFWMSLFGENSNFWLVFWTADGFRLIAVLGAELGAWLVGVGDLDVTRFVFHLNARMQWGNTPLANPRKPF